MEELTLSSEGLQADQDKFQINRVLDLLFRGKDPEGRAYSIESACREVGISPRTWYRWAAEGLLDEPKAALAAEMNNVIQEVVIPRYREIYEGLVMLALGQRPTGAGFFFEVKAADMLRAIKLLGTMFPVRPMTPPEPEGGQDAADFLAGAEFKQIFVKGDMNFIYQGNGQPQFGALKDGDETVEGEIVDPPA